MIQRPKRFRNNVALPLRRPFDAHGIAHAEGKGVLCIFGVCFWPKAEKTARRDFNRYVLPKAKLATVLFSVLT